MCQLRHCSQESTSEQLHGHKQELAKLDKSLAESTAALEGHKKEFAAHKEATGKGLEAHQQALESHKAETTKSFETQQQALAKHKEEATSQLEAHKKEFAAHKEATGKGLEAHQQALESYKAETTKSFETQQQALAKHKEEATSQLEAHKKEFAAHKEATGKGLEAHQQALESHKAETTKSFETQQQALEIQKKSTAEQIESHKKEVAVTSKQVSTFEKLIASQEEKSLQSLQAAVKELKDELQKMEKSRAAERAEIDQIKKQLELQRSAAAKPGAPAPPAPPVPPKAPPKWWKWWPWWLLAWRNSWTLERLSPKKSGFLGARFGGTSLTIENSDKAIKVIVEQKLRNASVELQLELQRYTSGKKKVLQEILLCVDWQWQSERLFRKTYEALPFGVIFLRCLFLDEWIRIIPVPLNLRANMEWKGTCKVVLKEIFVKSRPLGKKESRRDKLAKSKRAKIGSFIRWFICQILPVLLTLSTFFSHKFCRLLICWQLCFSWMHAELLDGTGGGVVACLRLRKRTCLRRVLRTLSLISSVSFFSFSPSFSSSCSTTFVATHGAVSTSKTLDFAGATRTGDSWGISVTCMVHDADQTKDDLRLMRLWYWQFDYWWKGSCQ